MSDGGRTVGEENGGDTAGDGGKSEDTTGDAGPRESPVSLAPATRASLLYGVIGGLAFLVLVQGFELLADPRVTLDAKVGVAVLIAVAAAGSTYALRTRVAA